MNAALSLPADAGTVLLPLARSAIAKRWHRAVELKLEHPGWLDEPGASFVTLAKAGALRGCIGSLQAYRSLGDDVAGNAQQAAFGDPRFHPVSADELDQLSIEVSVLSVPQQLNFTSEADALTSLRPGIDGVVLRYGGHRATYLPQVWQQLPKPAIFLASLKRKAGLSADFWNDGVELERYTVTAWSQEGPDGR